MQLKPSRGGATCHKSCARLTVERGDRSGAKTRTACERQQEMPERDEPAPPEIGTELDPRRQGEGEAKTRRGEGSSVWPKRTTTKPEANYSGVIRQSRWGILGGTVARGASGLRLFPCGFRRWTRSVGALMSWRLADRPGWTLVPGWTAQVRCEVHETESSEDAFKKSLNA